MNLWNKCIFNHIDGVLGRMLALSEVGGGFTPWSAQTKDYEIGICCFSIRHAAFSKSNDWLARNRYNVSKSGVISCFSELALYIYI
jgi:hypothetical protein